MFHLVALTENKYSQLDEEQPMEID
nr:ORF6 protein [Severe acute respiratory syndrome coronavirus 2]